MMVDKEDVDFLKEADGLLMLPSVQEKLKVTMEQIDLLHKESKMYTWVIVPTLAVQMFLAFFTEAHLAWLLTFLFSTAMIFFQFRAINKARRLLMFVEGMMYVTIQTSKDFAQFKSDVEGKITPEIKMAIANLRKED